VVVFQDINISMVVEKTINGQKVPIPMMIEKAQEATMESITRQIDDAKSQELGRAGYRVLRKRQKDWSGCIIICLDLSEDMFGNTC
jgi:hypothetical protein